MLYLEDYLEMIEHLPQELRDRFTEIREMDLQVHNAMDSLEDEVKQFFLNAKRMKPEQRETEYQKLRQDYYKTLEDADEKVNFANQIYELVEKYLRRLDQELQKFKIELEADNAGITEVLERRSLELDNPPVVSNHAREKRRFANPNYHGHYARDSTHSLGYPSNNMTQRLNSNMYSPQPGLVSPGSNGNSALHGSLPPSLSNLANSSPLLSSVAASPASGHGLPLNYNPLGSANPLAAAASQAIAATQQMQQGRRTASLKASIEAISGSSPFPGASSILGGEMPSLSHLTGSSNYLLDGSVANPRRRARASSHFNEDDRSSDSIRHHLDSENGLSNNPPEWMGSTYDPNEPRYCVCNQISYGEMVACDYEDCDREWFHYGCVGLSQAPKGKWYCPQCAPLMSDGGQPKKKKQRTQQATSAAASAASSSSEKP